MRIHVTLEAADQIAWFDCSCEIRFEDTPAVVKDAENPYYEEREAFIHQMMQHENRHAIGPRILEIRIEGMKEEVAGREFLSRWENLVFWVQTEDHIFVVQPTLNALVIPKRQMRGADGIASFTNALRERLKERRLTSRQSQRGQ